MFSKSPALLLFDNPLILCCAVLYCAVLFGAGCVHAAMDLFKYAYQLYPFVSSDLLRDCLELAITARKLDMRASPYDVSHVADCSGKISESRCPTSFIIIQY